MPESHFVIRQCTRSDCQFRFPVEAGHQRAGICPTCGAATIVAVAIQPAVAGPNPAVIPTSPRLEALLDNIRSTFNVGAIFRTADGAGFSHVHLCGITPTPEHPKVGKTALGAEASLAWSYHRNSLAAARELKSQGAVLWALEGASDAVSLFECAAADRPPAPLVLIAGNEVTGVDPELLMLCDRVVWLPMHGSKESLNVAVAFSIAAYTLRYRFTV